LQRLSVAGRIGDFDIFCLSTPWQQHEKEKMNVVFHDQKEAPVLRR